MSESVVIKRTTSRDVLFGRGGRTNNHSGNINFRKLVLKNKPRYVKATKTKKPNVARKIVSIWRSKGGRFLMPHPDSVNDSSKSKGSRRRNNRGQERPPILWIEVSDEKAREKTSQCLREREKPAVASALDTSLQLSTSASSPSVKSVKRKREDLDLDDKRNSASKPSKRDRMITLLASDTSPSSAKEQPISQETLDNIKERTSKEALALLALARSNSEDYRKSSEPQGLSTASTGLSERFSIPLPSSYIQASILEEARLRSLLQPNILGAPATCLGEMRSLPLPLLMRERPQLAHLSNGNLMSHTRNPISFNPILQDMLAKQKIRLAQQRKVMQDAILLKAFQDNYEQTNINVKTVNPTPLPTMENAIVDIEKEKTISARMLKIKKLHSLF